MPDIELYYSGEQHLLKFPENIDLKIIEPEKLKVIENEAGAIDHSVTHPIGCLRLKDQVKPGQKVALVVTDITRKIPGDLIVKSLLDELGKAGVDDLYIADCAVTQHRLDALSLRMEAVHEGFGK